jgi:hypothetical protein
MNAPSGIGNPLISVARVAIRDTMSTDVSQRSVSSTDHDTSERSARTRS